MNTLLSPKPGLIWIALTIFLHSWQAGSAQDTITYTIEQAEKRFAEKNLLLLAQKYEVDRRDALIRQARAFRNPEIFAAVNLYDPENERVFHAGQDGEKIFSVEQVIGLSGRRSLEIDL